MFSEDALLPISALQHLLFCERQCALIHLERIWLENPLTIEGTHNHRTVDEGGPRSELRGDRRTTRGLLLRSLRYGLTGRADVVEFHRVEDLWRPFPVEHKRGRPKKNRCDEVQLCAQALCLEEMLEVEVPAGALFYGTKRRRLEISFDEKLRAVTESTAERLHELIREGRTPTATRAPKCRQCSLLPACMPPSEKAPRRARTYLSQALHESTGAGS